MAGDVIAPWAYAALGASSIVAPAATAATAVRNAIRRLVEVLLLSCRADGTGCALMPVGAPEHRSLVRSHFPAGVQG
ncbi:hypothetical protein TH66_17135 [Carbonactinospora thermoautotrophica]|uniref:Uncharacterized protein n=1 Tax=Carbonactinospora thermoautotrophica TaxID=1469144 RepID=A0A132MRK9_9ACTN|nr:hypothetical protein TH66_17135 [Carbonactinospora thermoautotrophica]KWX05642.1 hypothetical protein TR74_23650 [Carbonactinospora thermoautotrophica]